MKWEVGDGVGWVGKGERMGGRGQRGRMGGSGNVHRERQNPVKVGVCFSIVFAPRTRSSFHHLFHVFHDSWPHAAIANACDRVVWGSERV